MAQVSYRNVTLTMDTSGFDQVFSGAVASAARADHQHAVLESSREKIPWCSCETTEVTQFGDPQPHYLVVEADPDCRQAEHSAWGRRRILKELREDEDAAS